MPPVAVSKSLGPPADGVWDGPEHGRTTQVPAFQYVSAPILSAIAWRAAPRDVGADQTSTYKPFALDYRFSSQTACKTERFGLGRHTRRDFGRILDKQGCV